MAGRLLAQVPSLTFMGTFDGQGHTINGIIVNRDGSAYNGLFGFVGGLDGYYAYGEVKNLSLKQSSITGGNHTGGLVGYLQYGRVTNCFTDAAVNGGQYVGGLVGTMEGHSTNDITAYVTKSLYMPTSVSSTSGPPEGDSARSAAALNVFIAALSKRSVRGVCQ